VIINRYSISKKIIVLTGVRRQQLHFVEVGGFAVIVDDHGRGSGPSRVIHFCLETALAPAHQRYPGPGVRRFLDAVDGGRAPVSVTVRADHVQQHTGCGPHVILAELADLWFFRLDHDARGHVVASHVQVRGRIRVGCLIDGGRGGRPRVRRRGNAD